MDAPAKCFFVYQPRTRSFRNLYFHPPSSPELDPSPIIGTGLHDPPPQSLPSLGSMEFEPIFFRKVE